MTDYHAKYIAYALGGNSKPISVAEWDTRLTDSLPEELQESLPTIEQIEAELARMPEKANARGDEPAGAKRANRTVGHRGRAKARGRP